MATPVFVSTVGWDALDAQVRDLIQDVIEQGSTVLATPDGRGPEISGLGTRVAATDRPLELQRAAAGWLAQVDEPVLIATHVTAEPVVLSRRYPCGLIESRRHPRPTGQFVALIDRCGLIVGTQDLRQEFDIPNERFADLRTVDGSRFIRLVDELIPRAPDVALHRSLTAELFGRVSIAAEQVSLISAQTPYTRHRIRERLRGESSPQELISECLAVHDEKGAAIASVMGGGSLPIDMISNLPGLIKTLVSLLSATTLSEVLRYPEAQQFASTSSWTQRLVLMRALDLLGDGGSVAPSEVSQCLEMLAASSLEPDLGPDHIAAIGALDDRPPGFLEKVAETGSRFTAMAAELEMSRCALERGERVGVERLKAAIDEIDAESWHPGLWRSGLKYWADMTSRSWNLEGSHLTPPEPLAKASSAAIGDIDAAAREALAAGDYRSAIAGFETARVACLATNPPTGTTELAARMNIGWTLWEAGYAEGTWAPYMCSALEDVRPSAELVRLRTRLEHVVAQADEATEIRGSRAGGSPIMSRRVRDRAVALVRRHPRLRRLEISVRRRLGH